MESENENSIGSLKVKEIDLYTKQPAQIHGCQVQIKKNYRLMKILNNQQPSGPIPLNKYWNLNQFSVDKMENL